MQKLCYLFYQEYILLGLCHQQITKRKYKPVNKLLGALVLIINHFNNPILLRFFLICSTNNNTDAPEDKWRSGGTRDDCPQHASLTDRGSGSQQQHKYT